MPSKTTDQLQRLERQLDQTSRADGFTVLPMVTASVPASALKEPAAEVISLTLAHLERAQSAPYRRAA